MTPIATPLQQGGRPERSGLLFLKLHMKRAVAAFEKAFPKTTVELEAAGQGLTDPAPPGRLDRYYTGHWQATVVRSSP